MHLQVELAEARRPVVPRRRGDRVGDERRARPPRGAPHGADRLGREVDAVDDDRDEHVVARERRADDARVAVQERPHRVEEMRHAARAAVERGVRLLRRSRRCGRARRRRRARAAGRSARRRPGAPARASSAAPGPASSSRSRSARSGSRRADASCVPRRFGDRNGPSRCMPRIARPTDVVDGHLAHRREHLLLGARDQRREIRGHAGLEQRLAGAPVGARVRVEEVDAAEPVHLQVDEARERRCRGRSGVATPNAATRPSTTSTSPATKTPSTSAASTPSLPSHRRKSRSGPRVWSIPVGGNRSDTRLMSRRVGLYHRRMAGIGSSA